VVKFYAFNDGLAFGSPNDFAQGNWFTRQWYRVVAWSGDQNALATV